MRATDFEFRYRLWFIGLIFWVAFSCYAFDHKSAGEALAQWMVGAHGDLNSASGRNLVHLVFLLASLLVIAAALIRTWASAYLRSEVVHDMNLRSETVVADGPFRYVRNPLYLGNILLAAGIGLLASRIGWFILVVGMVFFLLRLIGREEKVLLKSQGETFQAFMTFVPRLWPSFHPRISSRGTTPQWGQALAGEALIWAFAFAALGFAVTLRLKLFYWVIIIGLAVRLIGSMIERSKRRELKEGGGKNVGGAQ